MKSLSRWFLYGLVWVSSVANSAELSQVQHDKSSVSFGYKQMGVAMDGKFRKFVAKLNFDPSKPAAANAQIDIDLASIDTGTSEGDEEVAGKQWFNSKAFPSAKFVSTRVKSLGADRFEVAGKLSIKGKSVDAIAPFTFKPQGNVGAFDGTLLIKRLDFAIGEGPWADVSTVANEVQIKFHIVANAAPAAAAPKK